MGELIPLPEPVRVALGDRPRSVLIDSAALAQVRPARGASVADTYARVPGPLPEIPAEVPHDPAPELDVPQAPGLPPHLIPRLYRNAVWHARWLLADSVNPEPAPALDLNEDLVRLTALYPDIASSLKLPPLKEDALAWTYGGREGLRVAKEKWTPSELEAARARTALEAAELGEFTVELDGGKPTNRFTFTDPRFQLRLGRDGRWYPFRPVMRFRDWVAAGPADRDPAMAFDVPPPVKPKRPRRKRIPDC